MMGTRRSFQSDVSFLEKIAMGAVGTRRVLEDLSKQGHCPLVLERGSTSFKIWKKVKIKRIRVPDILCVTCGSRVESRSKTTLEISMSHSTSDPERGWDYGLDDRDYVALVVCGRSGDRPIDWQADELVQYFHVGELRSAQGKGAAFLVRPKGAEEGFEARASWPAVVASSCGTVVSVAEDRIQYLREADSKKITLRLLRQAVLVEPLVAKGEAVVRNQVLAAVVPVVRSLPCSKSITPRYYLARLAGPSLSERYTAAKALALAKSRTVSRTLLAKTNDTNEHIYVRLEAAAGLARQGMEEGWAFIEKCLADEYLQNRLEAVIILGEIQTKTSCRLLCDVLLDPQQHPEIRAGAAWALGELENHQALNALIDSFSAVDEGIRFEAARALAKLAATRPIAGQLPLALPEKRAGIAWALSKSRAFELEDLLNTLVDEDARQWVSYVLGTQDQKRYVDEIEKLKERDLKSTSP